MRPFIIIYVLHLFQNRLLSMRHRKRLVTENNTLKQTEKTTAIWHSGIWKSFIVDDFTSHDISFSYIFFCVFRPSEGHMSISILYFLIFPSPIFCLHFTMFSLPVISPLWICVFPSPTLESIHFRTFSRKTYLSDPSSPFIWFLKIHFSFNFDQAWCWLLSPQMFEDLVC